MGLLKPSAGSCTPGIHVYMFTCFGVCTMYSIHVTPIEEVMLDTNDHITLASKLLIREEHWIRELGSILMA